jgi:hypothetical protein
MLPQANTSWAMWVPWWSIHIHIKKGQNTSIISHMGRP